MIHLYCDGGCRPSPGKGGWGVVIIYPSGQVAQHCGYLGDSTNNRAELSSLISGLQRIDPSQEVTVFSDSRYVIDGFSRGWIDNWKKNGWKTSKKEPVANKDLWLQASEIVKGRNIIWTWVKAHAGNQYNELADSLATLAITNGKKNDEKLDP
jgi:ribonuclease HI